MNRRHILLSVAAITLAIATPVFAAGSDPIPGFTEAVAAGGPVLVHVTAPWCGECKLQKPIVAKLLGTPDFKDMKEFKVDFDTQKDALKLLHVQMQSTLIVYKDGKEVDRMTGKTKPAVIEAIMRKAL
ncbi:thioredoxin family protein [Rhizobium leguminosarum bv. trifolii]|uniref:thioredoxin family protein n=1 Tax=Rhizobium ruizarguesonis TaxID=2081791 RepID=UPI001031FFEB|nr:thioredoxin family protein [Rhizobium ruizarguesonis]QIO44601.1 thioredoxin family protein [Rhizobium leguminosarum bv. trifolii]TAY20529.1 thioredoxin [Rhizobium ruizarguesonis]